MAKLNDTEAAILRALSQHPATIEQSEPRGVTRVYLGITQERVGFHSGAQVTTKQIEALVERGLVKVFDQDGEQRYVITHQGEEELERWTTETSAGPEATS
jgi:predicted transcriptional regulator